MSELTDALQALDRKVRHFAGVVRLEQKEAEIRTHEARMGDPSFWNDQGAARRVVQQLKSLKSVVEPCRQLLREVADTRELVGMAEQDADASSLSELRAEVQRLDRVYDELELKLALSGKYDANNVFMTIKPGAGGVESCDWAEMLFRMYSQFCNKQGWKLSIVEMQPAEVAGLKTCTLRIEGENAYGNFKSEMGTHRLVRISPFDANARRQTSFAAVEITPELDDAEEVDMSAIPEKDLRIDTYRAGGAGGQHVNKTDSAVRITHIPTNIAVACQQERSQQQNRLMAMKMLAAKLQQLKDAERLEELQDLKGERGTIGWGHQIRSYVMMPYQMVKDLRTGHETSRIQEVLDGDLQPFVDAYLRWLLAGRPNRKGGADPDLDGPGVN